MYFTSYIVHVYTENNYFEICTDLNFIPISQEYITEHCFMILSLSANGVSMSAEK